MNIERFQDCWISISRGQKSPIFLASRENGECRDHLLGSPGVGCCTARHITASSQMSITSPLFGRKRRFCASLQISYSSQYGKKRDVCYAIFSLSTIKSLSLEIYQSLIIRKSSQISDVGEKSSGLSSEEQFMS